MIDRMEHMKETLMVCIEEQLKDLSSVSTKELGEAIDMIKDLSESIYYCTITKSMEESEEAKYYTPTQYRDMYKYYYSPEEHHPIEIRDYREGTSPIMRKNYMEMKKHGGAKEAQIHELEKYTQELTKDIKEMAEGASPEEKHMLQTNLATLTNSIV